MEDILILISKECIKLDDLIKCFLLDRKKITFNDFQETIKQWCINVMYSLNKNQLRDFNPIIKIDNFRKYYENASVHVKNKKDFILNIDDQFFLNAYTSEYNFFEFLYFLFHELIHVYQYINAFSGKCDMDTINFIKEFIIHEESIEYIDQNDDKIMDYKWYWWGNYDFILCEIEARIKGMQLMLILFKQLGLEDKYGSLCIELRQSIHNEIEKSKNSTRIVDTDFCNVDNPTVDSIFNYIIKTRPHLLLKYPQLKYLYIEDEGQVRPKSREELILTLEENEDNINLSNYINQLLSDMATKKGK